MNKWIKYYPDKIQRSKRMWKYTYDRLMPLEPKFELRCPICGGDDVSFKHRTVFSPFPGEYRIDMHYKCMNCDYVMVFGVHVEKEYAEKIGFGTMHVREVIGQ